MCFTGSDVACKAQMNYNNYSQQINVLTWSCSQARFAGGEYSNADENLPDMTQSPEITGCIHVQLVSFLEVRTF